MSSEDYSYVSRLQMLQAEKLKEAEETRQLFGAMDHDEWGIVLPPASSREVVETVSASGVVSRDVLFNFVTMEPNHPNGDFYGAAAVGRNYRKILENHPVFIDQQSSLAGAYMTNFYSYRKTQWKPEYSFANLQEAQELYAIVHGIGGPQHMCQDNQIALSLGLNGLLGRVRCHGLRNPGEAEFYTALEDILLGLMNWISRTASEAGRLARDAEVPGARKNLEEIAEINLALLERPPETFREACQLVLWVQLFLRMYNGSGSLGRLDLHLMPYYAAEKQKGRLTDEEAVFHLACLLVRDTAYIQLGGYDESGHDNTNAVSYLILEAAHRLKAPANIGIAVADDIEDKLFRRGVDVILEDKRGYPKFLGMKNMVEGFVRSGYPIEAARQRVYAGCHWHAIPGREYPHMDMMKVNLPRVLEVAFQDLMADKGYDKTVPALWRKFAFHLEQCIDCIKAGCDVHRAHMHEVFPELPIDLLCYGPVEKGKDASDGSLEYYDYGVDAAGLATVADSFGAIDQRIGREKRMTMGQLSGFLADNWQGEGGEYGRRMMSSCPRFGQGGSAADRYAQEIIELFTSLVAERPTPGGTRLVPGVFGWASMIDMGKAVGASPNGRFAREPISHGPNPSHGFRTDNAPTALLKAVAKVQPGRGNASPAQLDLDPTIAVGADAGSLVAGLIRAHFHDGGTQISLNVMDREEVLKAYDDPAAYPELVVRVTGFSAYFASLSPELRRFVVERIVRQ